MQAFRYLAFNKPYGIPSTFTDEAGRRTLKDFIPVAEVYAAGRLDLTSEGLLILSNDGGFIHRLTDPEHHLPKVYLVQVEGSINDQAIVQLESGVIIDGEMTRRSKVLEIPEPPLPERGKPVTPHGPTTWLRIELREGKKHQIRRMTAAVGLPTLRILRIAIGPVTLGEMQPGEWRELTNEEVVSILRQGRRNSLRVSR
jgi:23S rRNA pseudouridine2457 synthase